MLELAVIQTFGETLAIGGVVVVAVVLWVVIWLANRYEQKLAEEL